MKKQEAFEKALRGVVGQGCKSTGLVDSVIQCKYRHITEIDNKELRCAVGWLLTEEQLKHLGDNNPPASGLMSIMPPGTKIIDDLDEELETTFLTHLQVAHDGVDTFGRSDTFVEKYKAAMHRFASRWGLTFPDLPAA